MIVFPEGLKFKLLKFSLRMAGVIRLWVSASATPNSLSLNQISCDAYGGRETWTAIGLGHCRSEDQIRIF